MVKSNMKAVKQENIEYNIIKKWKDKIPEVEKIHDLQKAIDKIKQNLTDNVKEKLFYKGYNLKQRMIVGDVLGKSIDQMVEEMAQEIDVGGIK